MQAGRPWRSVLAEGGGCRAPLAAPFLGMTWNKIPIFYWISSSSSWRRPSLELTPPIRPHLLQTFPAQHISVPGTWGRGEEVQGALLQPGTSHRRGREGR